MMRELKPHIPFEVIKSFDMNFQLPITPPVPTGIQIGDMIGGLLPDHEKGVPLDYCVQSLNYKENQKITYNIFCAEDESLHLSSIEYGSIK